jgi:hypothetical protein
MRSLRISRDETEQLLASMMVAIMVALLAMILT